MTPPPIPSARRVRQSLTISTRRLFARPSGVVFFVTGFVSPYHLAESWSALTA